MSNIKATELAEEILDIIEEGGSQIYQLAEIESMCKQVLGKKGYRNYDADDEEDEDEEE